MSSAVALEHARAAPRVTRPWERTPAKSHRGRTRFRTVRPVSRRNFPSEEDLRQLLRRNVRALRLAADLTVKQAAARAGLNPRHWQKIEEGTCNVTIKTQAKLCKAFTCPLQDLFGDPSRHGPVGIKR